jgi:hypothetical protein
MPWIIEAWFAYVKALAEFVWNALDADATKVSVNLIRNALRSEGVRFVPDSPLEEDGFELSVPR